MATRKSERTSNLQGIISKSNPIKEGPPKRYKLILKKQKTEGKSEKLTFGERDHSKANRTIVMVGVTGSGKSSLINAMVNYVMGVEMEDQVWFEVIEQGKRTPTSKITVYEIFGFEDLIVPYSLTIIDTPGDITWKKDEIENIQDLFTSTNRNDHIDAVGLVMKKSENQLCYKQKQMFDLFISYFGKDNENKIVALFTHSDGGPATNALEALKNEDIICAKDEKNQPVHFLFNNYQTLTILSEKHKRAMKFAWETTMEGMKELSEFLRQVAPQELKITANVLTEHENLQSSSQRDKEHLRFPPDNYSNKDKLFLGQIAPQELKMTANVLTEHENLPSSSQKDKKHSGFPPDNHSNEDTFLHRQVAPQQWKKTANVLTKNENLNSSSQRDKEHLRFAPDNHSNRDKLVSKGVSITTVNRAEAAPSSVENQLPGTPVSIVKSRVKRAIDQFQLKEKYVPCTKTTRSEPAPWKSGVLKSASDKKPLASFGVKPKYVPGSTTTRLEAAPSRSTSVVQQTDTAATTQTNTSATAGSQRTIYKPSKLQDIISKSTLIHTGPPTIYQLVPKKQCLDGRSEKESKLKRWTIGEKDPNKVNRTVLMVGETGAGKTTMINAMVNYVLGVEREDKIWFEITNEGKKSQTESQTSEVIAYDIFGFEGCRVPYSLTIIDTPGYGDTRGIQEDQLITERLRDLFRSPEGIDQIDAVGFVVKASTNRLSDRQRNIFDAVLSLFGKDMKDQIVTLISNSDGGPAKNALQALKNAKIKCAKNSDNQPVHFLFNNRQTEIVTNKKEERAMSLAWEITQEGMEEFSEFLGIVSPQKL